MLGDYLRRELGMDHQWLYRSALLSTVGCIQIVVTGHNSQVTYVEISSLGQVDTKTAGDDFISRDNATTTGIVPEVVLRVICLNRHMMRVCVRRCYVASRNPCKSLLAISWNDSTFRWRLSMEPLEHYNELSNEYESKWVLELPSLKWNWNSRWRWNKVKRDFRTWENHEKEAQLHFVI